MIQQLVIALGVATLGVALLHLVGGGRDCARPMLAADFDVVAKETVYVCWHIVSVNLALAGAVLLWAGFSPVTGQSRAMVAAVSSLDLCYGALFIVVGFRSSIPNASLALGQWIVFIPMGLLGWYALLAS